MSLPLEKALPSPPSNARPDNPRAVSSAGRAWEPSDPGRAGFAEVFTALGRRIDQGERVVDRATQRDMGSLGPADLIAVQAGIYRYVEAVDLASKLVDRASNALRSVLQSNA